MRRSASNRCSYVDDPDFLGLDDHRGERGFGSVAEAEDWSDRQVALGKIVAKLNLTMQSAFRGPVRDDCP